MRILPILIATGHYYKRDHTHKINHTTKFTLHSFTVSHVIDDVTGLCDVISTLADNRFQRRSQPVVTLRPKIERSQQSEHY